MEGRVLADLAGRDEQQRVDACERLIEAFGIAVIHFTRRHPEVRRFGGRAHKRYEIRGRHLFFSCLMTRWPSCPAAPVMAMVMVRSPHVSFCVQVSSESFSVTDQGQKIRLCPVVAQSGTVSHCCPS